MSGGGRSAPRRGGVGRGRSRSGVGVGGVEFGDGSSDLEVGVGGVGFGDRSSGRGRWGREMEFILYPPNREVRSEEGEGWEEEDEQ